MISMGQKQSSMSLSEVLLGPVAAEGALLGGDTGCAALDTGACGALLGGCWPFVILAVVGVVMCCGGLSSFGGSNVVISLTPGGSVVCSKKGKLTEIPYE